MTTPPDIRVLPLTGRPFHRGEDHPHTHGHDFIETGARELGALSYSLLRAEAMTLYRHRSSVARAVWKGFEEFDRQLERVRAIDPREADKLATQRPRLLVWDLIGLIGEACEQLGAVHTAVRAWTRSRADVATTLLGYNKSSRTVFQGVGFQDLPWWRNQLGVDPNPDRLAMLTSRQRRLVRAMLAQVDTRLPAALATQYTPELHRVAMRRKHLAPLLDATLGLAFATENPQAETWLNEQIAQGALILADDKIRPGTMSQIVIPVDDGIVSDLFMLWGHANWLSGSLASAVISRAELPARVVYTFDDSAAPPDPPGELLAALDAYAGRDPGQRQEESELDAWSKTVWRRANSEPPDAAMSSEPVMNRSERRTIARAQQRSARRNQDPR
jgi:hypothetical protein